jgi:hypothetical protein
VRAGEVIGGGWDLFKRFWRHLIPIALVVYLAISLIALVLTLIAGILGAIVSAVVAIAGVFWLQAALVEAVADVRDGRADLSIGDTLRRVWPRVPTVAVAGLLAGIAIAIGFVLLIAPGLFLLTIWCLIVPAIVLEGKGIMESFGRSRELVSGYGWTVCGVIVLTVLILLAASIVVSIVLSPLNDSLQQYVSDVISNTVFAPFVAATWTLMYFRLRELKEPAAAETLPAGAAFDEA